MRVCVSVLASECVGGIVFVIMLAMAVVRTRTLWSILVANGMYVGGEG